MSHKFKVVYFDHFGDQCKERYYATLMAGRIAVASKFTTEKFSELYSHVVIYDIRSQGMQPIYEWWHADYQEFTE